MTPAIVFGPGLQVELGLSGLPCQTFTFLLRRVATIINREMQDPLIQLLSRGDTRDADGISANKAVTGISSAAASK